MNAEEALNPERADWTVGWLENVALELHIRFRLRWWRLTSRWSEREKEVMFHLPLPPKNPVSVLTRDWVRTTAELVPHTPKYAWGRLNYGRFNVHDTVRPSRPLAQLGSKHMLHSGTSSGCKDQGYRPKAGSCHGFCYLKKYMVLKIKSI